MFDGMCSFDRRLHELYERELALMARPAKGLECRTCGNTLRTYYAERRLYLVDCPLCQKRALVKADNPKQACEKTFAVALPQGDQPKTKEEILQGLKERWQESLPILHELYALALDGFEQHDQKDKRRRSEEAYEYHCMMTTLKGMIREVTEALSATTDE